jgi:pimeloyl-ACP methyl ester carboxylesterase
VDQARYRAADRVLWSSVGASATERFLDLPKTGMRLRIQELGAGPPIVFIHGENTSGASWATLVAELPDLERCAASVGGFLGSRVAGCSRRRPRSPHPPGA